MKNVVAIAYIGKKKNKTFRGIYFDARFAVRHVSPELATEMVKYKDVFVEEGKLEDIREQLEKVFAEEEARQLAVSKEANVAEPLEVLRFAINRCIDAGQSDQAMTMVREMLAPEPTEMPNPDPGTGEEIDRTEIEAIQAAILALDSENTETDFTTTGKPRVKAVERVLGRDVTSEQVDTAWNEIK
ncbi:MAG: hypothetical protein K6L60_05665 [Oceanobacter sp.]